MATTKVAFGRVRTKTNQALPHRPSGSIGALARGTLDGVGPLVARMLATFTSLAWAGLLGGL